MKRLINKFSLIIIISLLDVSEIKSMSISLKDTIYFRKERPDMKSVILELIKKMNFKVDSGSCPGYFNNDKNEYYKNYFKVLNKEHKTSVFSNGVAIVSECIDQEKNYLKESIILEEWHFKDSISARKAFKLLTQKKPESLLGLENNSIELLYQNKILIINGMLGYNKNDSIMIKIKEEAEFLLNQ